MALFFYNATNAQPKSPADCKTGCTSNDVQIQAAYLSDASGNKLPNNFVCPASGTATVFLTLELTTNTPRVGVVIYDSIRNFTGGVPGALITVLTQCFGVALGNTAHKVTFTNPFVWTCGTPIVMTGVFIGWGTGNTNFCTGSGFQCPATSSKCFSLPPGQFIAIQIPNSSNGSETVCANTAGGTIGTFRLDTITVTNSNNVSVNFWQNNSGGVLSNCIPTSLITAYISGSATIFAKIKNNSDTTVFSIATITLTVDNVSAGSIGSDQTICRGGDPAAFTSVDGSGAGTITYQWQSSTTNCSTGFTNISGANSATYDAPPGLLITTYYHRIDTSRVNGVVCTNTSNCVTVTVNNVNAGSISGSQTICKGGDPVVFGSVAATGTGTVSYQWQSSTTSCTAGFSNISGAVSETYDVPPGLATTTYYHRIATSTLNGAGCSDTTNCVTVTVNNVSAGSVAGGGPVCSGGDPAAFTSSTGATGTGTVTYQWQSSTTSCSAGFSNITGATNDTYDVPAGITTTTYYHRIATSTLNGAGCSDTSNCLTVTVNAVPASPTVTYNAPACDQNTFSVTIGNVQAGNVYTILDKNMNPIPGVSPASPHTAADNNNFNFSNIPAGSGYNVSVSSSAGCASGSSPVTCGTPSSIARAVTNTSEIPVQQPTVKVYPNPFSDKVKFMVTSPVSGNGNLEVYNMMGQRVKTVYQGFISSGTQTFEMSLPILQIANLVYVLRVGDKKVSGKLLQINQ
jgi:hypothetical protein